MSKKLFLTITPVFFLFQCYAQISTNWTTQELSQANTVSSVNYLNGVEKEVVIVLNLARLFPKRFVELELHSYNGTKKYGDYLLHSPYKKSLIEAMNNMAPLPAVQPSPELTSFAQCFAKESGITGKTGHDRRQCKGGYFAECCSYGMSTGKDIVMQLLIDHNVTSLGHRKICFTQSYLSVGVGFYTHSNSEYCCVIDII